MQHTHYLYHALVEAIEDRVGMDHHSAQAKSDIIARPSQKRAR